MLQAIAVTPVQGKLIQASDRCRRKDTVSEQDEYNEVQRIEHSAASNATLRPNGVIHHLVPVFTSQYLHQNADT